MEEISHGLGGKSLRVRGIETQNRFANVLGLARIRGDAFVDLGSFLRLAFFP